MGRRPTSADPDPGSGRYAFEGLERTIHEKARLGILASLVAHPEGILFGQLKELCALTDGNLNRHLKVLLDDGLVEVWKGGPAGRTKTLCRITPHGRERFLAYLALLERIVSDAAQAAADARPAPAGRSFREGWSPA